MKLIAVGDNVTDCYLDEGIYYPGGNAVNVAASRLRRKPCAMWAQTARMAFF